MRSTFRAFPFIFTILAVLLLLPAPAAATSCDADCEGEECHGDCEINSISCSTACSSDGCPGRAICKEYGTSQTGLSCSYEMTAECSVAGSGFPTGPEEQPGGLRAEPSSQWSVIAYSTDHLSPLGWDDVEVLATSSSTWARGALDALVAREREQTARQRQRVRSGELRVAPSPVQRRVHYAVSSGGHCVGVRLEVGERRLEGAGEAALLVLATVDAGGRIVAARPLHALGGADAAAMVRFLKKNTRLWRQDGGEGPFEAFVVLTTRGDGSAGWMVAGSRPLL